MCNTSSDWLEGAAVFVLIAVCCLGFVVFGTSKQSLSGLKHLFLKGPPPGRELAPYDEFLGKVLCFFSGLPRPPTYHLLPTTHPHLCPLTKVVLFLAFLLLTGVIMLFFAVVPLYSATGERRLTTEQGEDWQTPCAANDKAALALLGLS